MGGVSTRDHRFFLAGDRDAPRCPDHGRPRTCNPDVGAASFLARMSADSAIISVSVRHSSPRRAGHGAPLPRVTAVAVAGIFGGLGGCAFEVEVGYENPNVQLVAVVPETIRHELDLVFVVDDGADMAPVHAALGELWGRIRRHLEYAEGGFPDVRVGIVTTDVGVGAATVPGCTAAGDAGALVGGDWITATAVDLDAADEAIAARFGAIGAGTCPFEQPLTAMQRALDGFVAAGAVRDAAALGVVFVAGADDCSVQDPAFFTEGEAGSDTFRCFRAGVWCEDDVGAIGPQYGCEPRPAGAMTVDVPSHVKLLLETKEDPRAIAVGTVLGTPAEVRIVDDGGGLDLAPACADAPGPVGPVYPGIRLDAFARDRNIKGSVADLCTQTLAEAGTPTSLDLRRALGHRCLEGRIADVEPDEPGMQTECRVEIATGVAAPVELPACANPNRVYESPGPCFAIKAGPAACGDFPSQLAVQINWGGADPTLAPAETVTRVECVVEDGGGPLDEPNNGLPD